MNRPIKFKAKHLYTKKWVYGVPATPILMFSYNEKEKEIIKRPIKPETLCQLVIVANGIEFYEGDIIEIEQAEIHITSKDTTNKYIKEQFYIKYNQEYCYYTLISLINGYGYDFKNLLFNYRVENIFKEVKGNIYE